MNEEKKARVGWAEPVLLVLWLALFVGSMTLFSACGPREDGSWMNCHRAQTALTVVGGAGLLLALLRCFCKRRVRRGLDLAALLLAILAILLPGTLIGLCMMPDMRCRAVMVPWTTVLAALAGIVALADLIFGGKRDKKP